MSTKLYTFLLVLATTQAAAISSRSGHDPAFCSVVFNHVTINNSGWPKNWNTLVDHGVKNWAGFLDPNLTGHPPHALPSLLAADSPVIIYNPSNAQTRLNLLKNTNTAPEYLELLNEPDIPLGGQPKISPQDAAKAMQPIIAYNKAHNATTLLSPVLSHPNDIYDANGWLEQYDHACGNCITDLHVPIIATHQYNLNAEGVIDSLQKIHARWPRHSLWVTELAPSTHVLNNCAMSIGQVGEWMETVVGKAKGLEYVGRAFWNSGEWRPTMSNHDCVHSLTFDNGTATPLLERYQSLCVDL